MRIAQATQQFQVQHQASQSQQQSSRLQAWVGDRRPASAQPTVARPAAAGDSDTPSARVRLSPAALTLPSPVLQTPAPAAHPKPVSSLAPTPTDKADASDAQAALTPQLSMIKDLMERLTGVRIEVYAAELQASASSIQIQQQSASASAATGSRTPAGFGLLYEESTVRQEYERLDVQMQGQIQTTDGRTIDFQLDLRMERMYREESSTRIALGDAAAPVDPLVLRFDGPAAALHNQRFAFDLQGDGKTDNVPLLAQGWGYLALDQNTNGRIDNGLELFGPRTDNGFAELAALDSDGNGWIDEADAAFKDLRIWRPNADGGGSLQSLQAEGIGALGLASAASPFALRSEGNASLGALRATSAYLREDGRAGALQQLDLAV
ncbi:MAG: hypothetical protein PHI55_08585 [Burkholderiaceae bacterium]|nr:hypothetical protein [Burkholderiaceae bacterium]